MSVYFVVVFDLESRRSIQTSVSFSVRYTMPVLRQESLSSLRSVLGYEVMEGPLLAKPDIMLYGQDFLAAVAACSICFNMEYHPAALQTYVR